MKNYLGKIEVVNILFQSFPNFIPVKNKGYVMSPAPILAVRVDITRALEP